MSQGAPLAHFRFRRQPSARTVRTIYLCSLGQVNPVLAAWEVHLSHRGGGTHKSRIFPSTRFFIAILLCLCYMSLSISTSNLSLSRVCMTKNGSNSGTITPKTKCELARIKKHALGQHPGHRVDLDEATWMQKSEDLDVTIESCREAEARKLNWGPFEEGFVFSAQNAGSLIMLFTGSQADRLNSKWTIVVALSLLVISNALLPVLADVSVWLVFMVRLLTGISDGLLQPSTSSLITRWFPPKERPFAIGLITGGRQIGTLLILPVSGYICRDEGSKEWRNIYFLSALIGALILFTWLLMSADKPSKHFCTSVTERFFVEEKIAEEKIGKRTEKRKVPWKKLARSPPVYMAVITLICHEYPLVIIIQYLPKYFEDVLKMGLMKIGLISALPIAVLFVAKTLSSSLASFLQARKKGRFLIARTPMVKLFNGIASVGMALCLGIMPFFNENQQFLAIVVLCVACAFAGLDTPGVQTALLQLAPAYTGIITGIAFGSVGVVSIINKLTTSKLVEEDSPEMWGVVFYISASIALIPVFIFTIWGSADRQPWATTYRVSKRSQAARSIRKLSCITISNTTTVDSPIKGSSPNPPPRIFVTKNSLVIDASKSESERNVEVGVEEDDCDSMYEQESDEAMASALRLQMFLADPSQEPGPNVEEPSNCNLVNGLVMVFPTFSAIPDISAKNEEEPSNSTNVEGSTNSSDSDVVRPTNTV